MDDVDEVLAHFGVKGMKWGVRRARRNGVDKGTGKPANEEALNAARLRQQARRSGTQSLSNKEMQTMLTRMDLESRYSKIVENERKNSRVGKVKKFIGKQMTDVATKKISEVATFENAKKGKDFLEAVVDLHFLEIPKINNL